MARTKKTETGPTLTGQLVATTPKPKAGGLNPHPGVSGSTMLQIRLGSEDPVKLPDSQGDLSCVTVLKDEYTVTSDAAGMAAFAANTSLPAAKCTWTVTAGVLAGTLTSTAHPQATAFQTEARMARMVALKVSITYIGQEQLESGYLSFQEYTSTSDIDGASIDAIHTGAAAQVRPGKGLVVFGDYTQEPRWEDPVSSAFMRNTFPVLMFVASGLEPSKATFRVRVVRWMEYLPKEGSLSEGEASYEPHDMGTLSMWGMLNHPRTSITSQDRWSDFVGEVKRVANAAYHVAQPLAPYVFPIARKVVKEAMSIGKLLV